MFIRARDRAWRAIAPDYTALIQLARRGLPFHIAAERRYDRSGHVDRLGPALRDGKTVFVPQIHQVLPRVMRLMVALRMAFMGGGREETSFLFVVDGAGREGLGLHHDDDVHAFWLQLEGHRTVTLGAPVPHGTAQDIPDRDARRMSLQTRALPPGSLLYLPPRTPHRVVCYERSVALSLTWSVARGRRRADSATAWDVASGSVLDLPAMSRTHVWTQVPAVEAGRMRRAVTLALPDGGRASVRGISQAVMHNLALMARFPRSALGSALTDLEGHGIVGAQDLPLAVVPDAPETLDGWRFA